jgi:hypothetical protein
LARRNALQQLFYYTRALRCIFEDTWIPGLSPFGLQSRPHEAVDDHERHEAELSIWQGILSPAINVFQGSLSWIGLIFPQPLFPTLISMKAPIDLSFVYHPPHSSCDSNCAANLITAFNIHRQAKKKGELVTSIFD